MRIRTIESSFVWLHRVLDILVPIALLYVITLLLEVPWHARYGVMGLIGGLSLTFFNQATGVYSDWRGRTLFAGAKKVLKAWIMTWAFLIVLAFLLKDSASFSRLSVTIWAITTPFGLFGYRLLIRMVLWRLRARGWNTKRVAIVGAGVLGRRIATSLGEDKMLGYVPTAFYDDDRQKAGTTIEGLPVAGTIDDLLSLHAIEQRYDEIYIALPLRAESRIKQLLDKLTDSTLIVKFIPDLFTFDLMHAKWTEIKGIPIISVYDTPLNTTFARLIKRSEDLLLASLILLLISPLMIALAIGVKLSSPGPVIFKQRRYGHNGKEIKVYKFRSMTTQDDGNIIHQAKKNDIRVTPFGAFIRRTSLDELPQFFNVLQGRMSIVGPRPHASAHNEQYRKLVPKYMQRHLVKPGITGWAQINGWRGETDTLDKMEKRIEYDLHYINNWSLWMDLRIIVLTAVKGFIHKHAY